MRRFVAFGIVAAVVLGAAAPAGAEQIGVTSANTSPVPPGPQAAVQVVAAPGEQNDVTVRATDPITTSDPNDPSNGWPLNVTVTDANATFDSAPPTGDSPCAIVDAHTARCTAPAGTFLTQAILQLGDGNNRIQFASDTVPLREEITTGDGNDDISTGPFVGDASYRYASFTGGGNDTVHIGPAVREWLSGGPLYGQPNAGLAVWTQGGNDTIYALNGNADAVDCGDGNDTLYADAWDSDTIYIEPSGSCEHRILPVAP
jgi:hypothetical protein